MATALLSFLWEQLSWHEWPERIEAYLLEFIEHSANFIKFFLGLLNQIRVFLFVSSVSLKTPCDLNRLTIESKEEIDACIWTAQRRTYVTLCTEQIPWANIKRVAKKYGFPCNAVVYSNTIGAVAQLMQDFQQKLNTTIQRTPVHRLPHRHDERCNDCLPQNSVHQRSTDLGATLLMLADSGKPASVFNILLKLPEENSQGQVSVDFEGSFSFEPLEDSRTPGLGGLVDIIPSCRVGQIGSLAVVVTTAGQLRIVLTVDERIFNGSTATFYKYVHHGLQELLLKG